MKQKINFKDENILKYFTTDVTRCVRLHTLLLVYCMFLGVVAQSLKLVKLSATCKRTQQLPTMLRLFARGFSLLG